ncbi:SubName: Full=Uncharacterized protein {ECO:0000313/EMBL:CCA75611.1} [Serendipita indica DSM 11827]|nr:SubName: Full=Uncharacterized protein {ECO:0000313/EMBL:CCA75611.1} [Serendipita indica DSM 11827]
MLQDDRQARRIKSKYGQYRTGCSRKRSRGLGYPRSSQAACRATKSIIDVKQAIDDNQGDWSDLVRRLEEYMWAIENQIDSLEKYPPQDRVVDEAFSQPLVRYVEVLEDIHCAIVNDRHTRPRTSHGAFTAIGKVKVDAGLIRKFNRDIEDRHRQFMEALALFTGYRVHAIEHKVEAVSSDVDASFIQLPMVASPHPRSTEPVYKERVRLSFRQSRIGLRMIPQTNQYSGSAT